MERIIKLLQEENPSRRVAKEVGCSQSAISKIWCKYKQNGKVTKGKHTGRPRKTSKKCTTKQMKHKWAETGCVCDRTIRNRLNEMRFKYRKVKRKPALTPKQKKTRLQRKKDQGKWQCLLQQSMHKCTLTFWTLFSFHQ
uniref:Transposase Tc1-like domain-containing protein n=1 Tax=Sinocyclocheilus grahami TaxID=75366 RepID=A0A672SN36_SINGR